MREAKFFALLCILISGYFSSAYAASDPAVEVEYVFSEPVFEQVDGGYHSIKMPDMSKFCDAVGLPLLPVKTAKILIPQRRDVKAVNIAPGKRITLDGEFKVEYGKPPAPMGFGVAVETKPNEKVYSSKEPFPGNLYSVVSTQFLCGYKILILNLYPVQYIPALGKVSYYENMKVIVAHAPAGPPGFQKAKCRGLREDRDRVERLVDNPFEMSTYTAEVTPLQDSPWEYLIITNEDMRGAFEILGNWKATNRGLATHIETIEDIMSNPNSLPYEFGRDDQETLRNFIAYAHDKQGTIYVVLGGDADTAKGKSGPIIPYRGVYGEVTGAAAGGSLGIYLDEDIPCDMYYGALDGNWDNDGDGIYGEGDRAAGGTGDAGDEADFFAEVFVGRIPADNAIEAANQIGKIIDYEEYVDHTSSVLLVGRKGDDITWGGDYKDDVYAYFPGEWLAYRLYERPWDRDEPYSQGALINQMNSDAHHIVNYCSHSGYTNDMGLSNDQIAGLTNTKYFLAYSQGCNAGGFDSGTRPRDDCAGEHFTVENDGGAFAYIGNTRYGWYIPGSPNEGLSQWFDEQIFHAIFTEYILNVGKAMQDSKEDVIGLVRAKGAMRWSYFEICLLGDPETPISVDPPSGPPVDIVAPAGVTNLAISSTTINSAVLTWTAPGDDGTAGIASEYDIRYSTSTITEENWDDATQCTNEPPPSPAGATETLTVTGLLPNTNYYFALKTADEVLKWSGLSNVVSGATKEAVPQTMHVSNIDMSLKWAGPNVNAIATVTIVDAWNVPVSQATTVYGHWNEEPVNTRSGVTDGGQVTFTSDRLRNPDPGTKFTFTVDNVVKDGWTYDSNANVETSDSISTSIAAALSATTGLGNAYPSPGNPNIWIPFALSNVEHVIIRIHDMNGRLIRVLDLGPKAPGAYWDKAKAAYWDGKNEAGEQVSSGIYFYTIQAGDFIATRKMIVTR